MTTTSPTPTVDVLLDEDAWRAAQEADLRVGLTATPRSIAPVWFYDERGSQLFDAITRLPEYYPTRAERSLLLAHGATIAEFGADTLVELGSGTSDKTTALLDAMTNAGHLRRYVPFDVSEETLRDAARALADRYPAITIHGVVGDFHHHLQDLPIGGRRLVAFLGGTIGNFRPDARRRFLVDLSEALGPDDLVLIGIDLVKDPATIVAAYDDASGVTAEFNRNALRVINHAVGGTFDPDGFDHVARWNAQERWIEMWLRSRAPQRIRLDGLDLDLDLAAGEEINTEISAKFAVGEFEAELACCGLTPVQAWVADGDEFALVLSAPTAA